MKKFSLLLILIPLLFASCSGNNGDSESKSNTNAAVNIATASVGGAYYAIGQEISNLVSAHAEGVNLSPEVTAGSVENPRLVDAGDADFGITNSNLANAALNGTDPYAKPLNVKAVGNLHPSIFHMITLDTSSINSLADLKGKKVAVGPAGGGSLPILELLLEQVGLTKDDIVPSYLSYSDGFTQLADGNVDVAIALSGYPASSVMEITATKDIKFINLNKEFMASISKQYPYYSGFDIPADTYNLSNDAYALGINNLLIVNGDISEDVVYQVTKAIYGNLEEFAQNNATAKQINAATSSETIIPLHEGAQKYFSEIN
ncbi:MAG: TAXI family TRAP transporter solute-binding subunit [Sphaerochaetaceae bacterium]|nr:TAXI family TRAP transporter solute-binding subunit [Sphaerochaetaceae bacterium]